MAIIDDIDFNEVTDEPVPEGVYLCEIQEEPTVEQKSGGRMVAMRMVITDECDSKGRMLFDNHCLWVNMGKLSMKAALISAGITPKKGQDLAEFVGKILKVLVVHEMYQRKDATGAPDPNYPPKLTARIKEYIPPKATAPAEETPSDLD